MTFQLCLPTSSDSHRRLIVRLCPPAALRLASLPNFPPRLPALSTCVSSQPSGSAFQLAFSSRLRPVFRPCPSTVSPTLIGNSSFQLCRPIALGLASPLDRPASPSNRPSDLRLPANLPALPSCFPSACASVQPSSLAFQLITDLLLGHQLRVTLEVLNLCMQVQIL